MSASPDDENSGKLREKGTQTDLTSSMIGHLRDELNQSSVKVCSLSAKLARTTTFSEESLHDDEYVRFYTGLPNFGVLKSVFEFVAPPNASATKLTHFQEFMVTLMKLRLDTPLKDLAYRFDVCSSTVSRIMLKWLTILTRLDCLAYTRSFTEDHARVFPCFVWRNGYRHIGLLRDFY